MLYQLSYARGSAQIVAWLGDAYPAAARLGLICK